MLKLFKKGTVGQLFVIMLVAILLWVRAFITPVPMAVESTYSPIYDLVYGWLFSMPYLSSAIAFVLVLGQGVWLNILLSNYKITNANSLLPLLLYVVAMSWDPSMLTITPSLLVNMAMLVLCSQLLTHGSTSLEVMNNFNASFFIGLATLCHLPAICLLVPFFLVFVTYKLYRWRDIVVSILGLIAPFIALALYAFLTDKLEYIWILFLHDISGVHFVVGSISGIQSVANLLFLVFLFIALIWQFGTGSEKITHQRINSRILVLPLLGIMLSMLYDRFFPANTQMFAIPFAYLMTGFLFVERKRRWISEVLLWLLLICAIV